MVEESGHEQFSGCSFLGSNDAPSAPVLWIVPGRRWIVHGDVGTGSRHAKCPQRGLSCAGHLQGQVGENPVAAQSVPSAALPHRWHAMWQANGEAATARPSRRRNHHIWSVLRCPICGQPGQWRVIHRCRLLLVMHIDLSAWGREEGAVLSSCDHKLSLCTITGWQPVADVGHGAWRLSLLSHFPLELVSSLRYKTSINLTLLSAAWRRRGTAV